MNLPKLTESIIRAAAPPQSFERGQDYYHSGAVSNTSIQDNLLIGDCEGTQAPYYRVQVELDEAGIRSANSLAPTSMADCVSIRSLCCWSMCITPSSSPCARTRLTCWLTLIVMT